MFTLEILYQDKLKKEFSKYYCKKYKKMFVISNSIECALKFKNIGSAKRAFNKYSKYLHFKGIQNLIGYDIKKENI